MTSPWLKRRSPIFAQLANSPHQPGSSPTAKGMLFVDTEV
jgi:hypothetical protein